MLINFNIEKLDKLLLDFYKITHLTISIWDSEINQLTYQPREMTHYCKLIRTTAKGRRRCYLSDKAICEKAKQERKAVSHVCHAGLVDTAVPIIFKDEILGYIMFGQVLNSSLDDKCKELIDSLSKELSINKEDLENSYFELTKNSQNSDIIESASNIMKMVTSFLWLSDMIEISNDRLINDIDDYIMKNLSANISISLLCKNFHISKNKLYALFRQKFKTTIANYIAQKRIEKAKILMNTTDMSISEIAFSVGVPDYNYFTKVFKKYEKMPPKKYKKQFDAQK